MRQEEQNRIMRAIYAKHILKEADDKAIDLMRGVEAMKAGLQDPYQAPAIRGFVREWIKKILNGGMMRDGDEEI